MNRPRVLPLVLASAVLSALTWVDWALNAGTVLGVPYPAPVMALLTANLVVTSRLPRVKRRLVAALQRYVVNFRVRLLLRLGVPLGWTLLETTGRRTGVRAWYRSARAGSAGRVGWWPSTAGPQRTSATWRPTPVRIGVRAGGRWCGERDGAGAAGRRPVRPAAVAVGRRHPLRALNAMMVRVLGTRPVTVRIDRDSPGQVRVRREARSDPRHIREAATRDPSADTAEPTCRAARDESQNAGGLARRSLGSRRGRLSVADPEHHEALFNRVRVLRRRVVAG